MAGVLEIAPKNGTATDTMLDPELLDGLPEEQRRNMVKSAIANLQVELFNRHCNLVANRGVPEATKPQLAQNGQQFPSQNQQDKERIDGLSKAIRNLRRQFADLLAMPDDEPEAVAP